MHIGIVGATGNIGQRVVAEALARGHSVTGYTRSIAAAPASTARLAWQELDVFDIDRVRQAIVGLDVLISLYQPGNAARDFDDTVRQSIADPSVYAKVARTLIQALEVQPRTRLIVVGGAGSLEIEPGRTLADSPDILRATLHSLGLPEGYAMAVQGHRDALNVLRLSNRLWTYLSPAADIHSGQRTGRFRLGGDQPVTDGEGRSRISFEDAAVALLDEVELPRFVQRRFTVGY